MAKIARLPDGQTITVPDDTTDAEMDELVNAHAGVASPPAKVSRLASGGGEDPQTTRRQLAPQDNSAWRYPRLAGHALANGLVGGTLGLPGDLGNLATWAGRAAAKAVGRDPGPEPTPFPGSAWMQENALGAVGLGPQPDLVPGAGADHPTMELLGSRALEGAAGSLGLSGLGAGVRFVPGLGALRPTIGSATANAAAGAGGAVGGGAAADVFPGSVPAALAGGLVGGVSGAAATGVAQRAVAAVSLRRATAAAQAEAEAAQAAKTNLANPETKSRQQVAAEAEHRGLHAEADEAVGDVVQAHGGPVDHETAGEALQGAARRFVTGGPGGVGNPAPGSYPALAAAHWEPVNAMVPDGATFPTPLRETVPIIDELTAGNGSLEPFSGLLSPRLARQMRERLDASRGRAQVAELAGEPAPPVLGSDSTWDEVRQLRAQVGAAMQNPSLSPGMDPENLKRLYAALSADQRSAVEGLPPQRGVAPTQVLDDANAATARLHDFVSGTLGRVINAERRGGDPAPGAMARGLLGEGKTDGQTLESLRQFFPRETNGLLAAHLGDPAEWNGLTDRAKRALASDPIHHGVLDSIAEARTSADAALEGTQAQVARDHAQARFQAGEDLKAATKRLRDLQAQGRASDMAMSDYAQAARMVQRLSAGGAAYGGASLLEPLLHLGPVGTAGAAALGFAAPRALAMLRRTPSLGPNALMGMVMGGEESGR